MKIASSLIAMTQAVMAGQYSQGRSISVENQPSERQQRTPDQVEKLKAKAADKRARKAAFRRNQSCLVEHLHQKEYNNV